MLLADIEEAETGDQGRMRHWMAQALRAQRDPAWMADGFVSDKWLPVSPITGKLDAFEWRAPFGQLEGPVEDGAVASVDTALRTLPPLQDLRPASAAPSPPSKVASPENRASVIEIEPAAPKPPRPAVEAVVSRPEATKKPEAVRQADQSPFFGGLPDDPGVRHTKLEPEPKTRLRLF
jgi:HemY protein